VKIRKNITAPGTTLIKKIHCQRSIGQPAAIVGPMAGQTSPSWRKSRFRSAAFSEQDRQVHRHRQRDECATGQALERATDDHHIQVCAKAQKIEKKTNATVLKRI